MQHDDRAAPRTKTVIEAAAAKANHGGLYSTFPYIAWIPGDALAVLDGRFNSHELREIANFMDTHEAQK